MKKLLLLSIVFVVGCIEWKWIRAIAEQLIAPGYSTCKKCHRPWKFVEGHDVYYAFGRGMFAVCEECWQHSTLPELKKYYGDVQKRWVTEGSNCDYNALMDSVETNFKRTHK